MARTTVADVRVLVTTTKSDANVQLIIDVASRQVDRLSATSCGSRLDAETLTDVELYLSAHMLSATTLDSTKKQSEKFENYSVTYAKAMTGKGIEGSEYGQIANMLSGGCLAEMDKRQATLFFAGGA